MKIILIIIFISILNCCNNQSSNTNVEKDDFIIIKQCEGVYEYSGKTLEKQLLFEIDKTSIYIAQPIVYINDEIEIGFRLKTNEKDSISFYSKFYSADKTENRTSKIIELDNNDIIKEEINLRTKEIKRDTFKECTRVSSSTRYKKYNCIHKDEDFERFYSEDISKSGDKVYSRKGNIYLKTKEGLKQITDFNEKFDSKFGNGYLAPGFYDDDNSILFNKKPKLMSMKKPVLYKYNIKNQRISKILTGEFLNRKISKDGNYLLFSRTKKIDYKDEIECRNHDVYIMNLITKEINKVGRGSYFEWKK